jgi:hypothetical protein
MTVLEYTLIEPKPSSDSGIEQKQKLTASTATLPEWCRLQYEIASEIDQLLKSLHLQKQIDSRLETKIAEINAKIDQYNNLVPNVYLRKTKLSVHNLDEIANLAVQWG